MKRVLFVMEWYSYETHKGIAQYAGEHGWHLNARMVLDGHVPSTWDGDGIITTSPTFFRGIKPLVETTPAKVVFLSSKEDDPYKPSICNDHRKIALLAASHLMSKGFKRFICAHKMASIPSDIRKDVFISAVKDAGGVVQAVLSDSNWENTQNRLRRVLRSQVTPLAVFATEDELVSDITEACMLEGLRIPEDAAILGVNNDEALCISCGVPVSSIECNLRQLGYEAAELLDRHMEDSSLPAQHHVLVHSPHVVTRRSTDTLAVDHPAVAKALEYIHSNYAEAISISDIAKLAGVSRAGLFNAFKAELGRTPGQEITRLRVEAAKRLLLETEESMDAIAFSTGFQTAQNMYVVFKKKLGVSPSQFRKNEGVGQLS